MTSTFIEPFDFSKIFINYFLGNQALFPYLFILIFSFVSAYLNLSNKIYLILLALGSLMFGAYMGQSLYVLTLFLTGLILFYIFGKIFK